MAAYAQESTFIPRRILVFVVIVIFHILLVIGLASGLARKVVEVIAPPIETTIVDEIQENEPPPPPPPPEMERLPVEVPPPEVSIVLPTEAPAPTAITNVTDKPVVRPPPPPPRPVQRVDARVDMKRFPNSEDYYPASSKRAEEQGSPVVRVCVGPNGRAAGQPTVTTSSGFPKLDEAAIKLAKAGRYIAGSVDGKAAESCISFRIKFEIKG